MGTLLNRRRYMGGGSSLPYDAEVFCIESTGTQYIQLDFGFDKTDEIYAQFSVDPSQKNDKFMVAPQTWNNKNNRFGMGVNDKNNSGVYTCSYGTYNTSYTKITPNIANDGLIHTWEYKDYTFKVADLDIQKQFSISDTFGGTTTNLKLFYGYNSNTKGYLKSYKHIKNGVVVCDLIPVRVGQTGYMYDKVSGQLLGNSGTGDFIVHETNPYIIVPIEYLKNNDSQYIQLPFGFDDTDEIDAEFDLLDLNVNKFMAAPQTWNNLSNNRFAFGGCSSSNKYLGFYYGSAGTDNNFTPLTVADGNTHRWTYSNHVCSVVDLGLSMNVGNITFAGSTTNIRLFYGFNSATKGIIRYYKHKKNNVEIDLIPVRVGSIGFLYDRKNNVLYAARTAGAFELGPDL